MFGEICSICNKPIYQIEECEIYVADEKEMLIRRGHKKCLQPLRKICYDWAKEIMDKHPEINRVMTESKLRELGLELLCKK